MIGPRFGLGLVVLTALGVTGCSAPAGSATLASPSASAAPQKSLDLAARDACGVLPSAAFSTLGVAPDPVERLMGPTATRCEWRTIDGHARLALVLNYGVGLEDIELVAGGAVEELTPMTVAGLPATRVDHVDSPTCRIGVGVAPTQLFSAEASELSADAPPLCPLAEALAEEVVSALRG